MRCIRLIGIPSTRGGSVAPDGVVGERHQEHDPRTGERFHIVTDTSHCRQVTARKGQDPVQIPEGEALVLRSTRIDGTASRPINP